MVYRSRNKKINNKKKIVSFLAVLAIISLFYFGKFSFLTGPLHYVGRPLWLIRNYSVETFSGLIDLVQLKESLIKENKSLKNQLNQVNSKLLLTELLMKENLALKETLGRTDIV